MHFLKISISGQLGLPWFACFLNAFYPELFICVFHESFCSSRSSFGDTYCLIPIDIPLLAEPKKSRSEAKSNGILEAKRSITPCSFAKTESNQVLFVYWSNHISFIRIGRSAMGNITKIDHPNGYRHIDCSGSFQKHVGKGCTPEPPGAG